MRRKSSSPTRLGRPPLRSLVLSLGLSLGPGLGLSACAGTHRGADSQQPGAAIPWASDAALGDGSQITSPDAKDLDGRVARLDLLVDLFDAARFGEDAAARARLWAALGGAPAEASGEAATRQAAVRLLAEALELDGTEGLSEAAQDFLVDAIMLLSVDVSPPQNAEGLETQTLAFRSLLEIGHERVQDNANWRLVDHALGVFEALPDGTPARRAEIGVHGMYLSADSVAPWLESAGVHTRAPLPSASQLSDPLKSRLEALEATPRWAPTLAKVRARVEAAMGSVAALWPADRAELPGPRRPRGFGRAEHLGPVALVDETHVTLGAGQASQQGFRRGDGRTAGAMDTRATLDGGGVLLATAVDGTSAPATYDFLQAAKDTQLAALEFAVREPRLEGAGSVVTALPLYLVRTADRGPSAMALRKARLAVRLSGRGAQLSIEGVPVDAAPLDADRLAVRVRQLRLAFPNEVAMRVEFAPDLQWSQLVDHLAALLGESTDPRFGVVTWWVDGPALLSSAPSPTGDAAFSEARIDARLALLGSGASWRVDRPEAFAPRDEAALGSLLTQLESCRLESEAKPSDPLRFDFKIFEGGVESVEVYTGKTKRKGKAKAKPKPDADAQAHSVQACADEAAEHFRLRDTRARFDMRVEQVLP